ncbi:MAG: RNA-binding transcriptional accessory protein [Clostridiales bacterium]|nr:RNA-binding transcriptional accessory protein [Clostridiales bacterium]
MNIPDRQNDSFLNIPALLAAELKITPAQAAAAVALIEDGNTIPFIARYRKEATGGIDDVTLRDLDERLLYLKNLEARKAEVLRLIDEQGKLTPELAAEIEKAVVLQRVEDLYKPFKQKRATRASKARERGLEPLADIIWAQEFTSGDPLDHAAPYISAERGVETAEEAIAGACDIIAERIADDADLIAALRNLTRARGLLVSESAEAAAATGAADAAKSPASPAVTAAKVEKNVYEMYRNFSEAAAKIPNHRVLALNRGEKEKKLHVRLQTDADFFAARISREVIKRRSIFSDLLQSTATDSYKRLIAPSLEREIRGELTLRAEADAIRIFARNTERLLMARPVRNARVIAIDPGFRTGCKVAVLDDMGKLLDYTTIYPTAPKNDVAGTVSALRNLIEKHRINVVVIGNGTASRETEDVVSDFLQKTFPEVKYTIVNEAGASVYSASKLASEECPDLDVTTRGAMSLGRRLQDPLAELVKIPPKSIGVGQYQHDLNQGQLDKALTASVENCVNRVGVDLNTASASLLTYIAGINAAVAKNIVAYRETNGGFTDRRQLKKVPKLGEKAFSQCAGFLRISGGKNPLDATSVHPESYAIAAAVADRADEDPAALADELRVGLPTLLDILAELEKPGRDPRDDAPEVVFSRQVKSIEDLAVGMELAGTVRNVVDFGAFVDIGIKNDGLVHISMLADRYIKHPGEVVAVGDTVKVWVAKIDREREKVSLSMVSMNNNSKL